MPFTITAVSPNPRQWNSTKGGPMLSYRIDLDGPDGPVAGVEWARKATSVAPTVGQQLDGTIDTSGSYGPKFKQAPAGGFGGGGPRVEDPKRAATILRQHSQDMSLRYAAIRQAQGKLPDTFSPADLFKLADLFDEDARKAGKAAA